MFTLVIGSDTISQRIFMQGGRKMNKKIDTIIFDLGKVLVDFHPVAGMKQLGFSKEAIESFERNIFSGLWEECDAKRMSDKEIRDCFKKAVPGFEHEVDILWDNITVVTSVYEHSGPWVKELKERGYKLYVLSNFGQQAFETNSKLYDFLDYMDGKVVSYDVEIVKPDKRIYECLIEKYGINPENAVFLDDRQVNIDGAAACGLNGIVFENYKQAKIELEQILK